MNNEDDTKEGDDTMASIAKPQDKVFVLDSSKVEQFMSKDNSKAVKAMKRFAERANGDIVGKPKKR